MIDDKNISVKRINLHNTAEVMTWCQILGCTEKQLADAVHAVGSVVAKIRQHLDM